MEESEKKIRVIEIFGAKDGVFQGEGKHIGTPSVFMRTFGCNFTCPGFGLPKGQKTTLVKDLVANIKESAKQGITLYKRAEDLPVISEGCDSYPSWHPAFKSYAKFYSLPELAKALLAQTPTGTFFPKDRSPIHLVITGGEPLLGWQRSYPDLMEHIRKLDPVWKYEDQFRLPVTFETNGTQNLDMVFSGVDVTFSVSPKLSASGEPWNKAIQPKIVYKYARRAPTYLKFVVGCVEDLDEVDKAVAEYNGVADWGYEVFCMPIGGTPESYQKHQTLDLVKEIIRRGYRFSPRLHVMVGGNGWNW